MSTATDPQARRRQGSARALRAVGPLLLVAFAQCAAAGRAAPSVRFATFNVALERERAGQLAAELAGADSAQAAAVAAVLQRVRPDVVLLNEFDWDETGTALAAFERSYLAVGQHGNAPLRYAHRFTAPVNTGVPSGLDLDGDGRADGPGDALGFGRWPGQYGMVVLSRFPIVESEVRTFQRFLWRDMPGALLPAEWYGERARARLPLSSKSHWDVPVRIGDRVVHVLACHPTPPVFDGPEDRNGRRNHDEIRLFADYLDAQRGGYLRDDRGRAGGLPAGAHFVLLGDLNADPVDGESAPGAIAQLRAHPRVQDPRPRSAGGPEQAVRQGGANASHRGDPATDTADFEDRRVGNLRVDYALPARSLAVVAAGVFWPGAGEPGAAWAAASSDHRLVWVDVRVPSDG
jgi:endonuclease/exonuclease/phosphatase family metal-dependent hydrolase